MTPEDYWYPWYPALFRNKTIALTLEQDAIYRRLIDHYMESRQPLPNNNAALARIVGCSIEIIEKNANGIMDAFFTHDNGILRHEFCDKQLDIQDAKSRRRSLNGEKAAKKRWSQSIDKEQKNANAMPDPMPKNATGQDRTGQDNNKHRDKIIHTVDFEKFWSAWNPFEMVKGSKKSAEKSFSKIYGKVPLDLILKKSAEYCSQCQRTKTKTKHVSTWLNQAGWEDEFQIEPERPKSGIPFAKGCDAFGTPIGEAVFDDY